jgi:hypothetical protein
MFGDIRSLQELKSSAILANFDSQFMEGVKGVAPCTFVDKGEPSPLLARAGMCGVLTRPCAAEFNTKQMDVCPITPWTCPPGQLPYNVLPERGAVTEFVGEATGGIPGQTSFPGKCKVAPPLKHAKGPDANGVYSDA